MIEQTPTPARMACSPLPCARGQYLPNLQYVFAAMLHPPNAICLTNIQINFRDDFRTRI
jgi:hypothetical protein